MSEPATNVVASPVLQLDHRPERRRAWIADVWNHRDVLMWLARSDFQSRYKRASLGVLWSVAVPLLQAAVVVTVFSRFARFGDFEGYPVYVLVGVTCWTYTLTCISGGSTAIVDGASIADKVWFPRAVLPLVHGLAAVPGFVISILIILVIAPLFDVTPEVRLLLLPVAVMLLYAFTNALVLVLAALHVYFRDVRFMVQAALLVWFWGTPIAYPQSFVGDLAPWLSLNPLTGVFALFRIAINGADYPWKGSVAVAVGMTLGLLAIAIEVHRRRDRLFIDLL